MKGVNKFIYSDHSMNVYHEAYSVSINTCICYEKSDELTKP